MRHGLSLFILAGFLLGQGRNWDSHAALLLPVKRLEVGLFQPSRYGVTEFLEVRSQPFLFLVFPNVSFKTGHKKVGNIRTASVLGVYCPTPLLNIISKRGIGGLIDPNIDVPFLMGVSSSFIMTTTKYAMQISAKAGLDLGLSFEKVDDRLSIDLPMLYHRVEVFHNKWGIHLGFDVTKELPKAFEVFFDFDLRLLPGAVNRGKASGYEMHYGNHSIEHKLLFIWNRTPRFRVMLGYKLVSGEYPYGSDIRILPFIPMLEKWLPMFELQWSFGGENRN